MGTTRIIWTLDQFPAFHDYLIIMVYLVIIFIWSTFVQNKKIRENPAYQYFRLGLFAKIFGAIALCLVYVLHYGLADTLGYYISSEAMVNLLLENPKAYFRIFLWGDLSSEALSAFNPNTGYPWYTHDASSFMVIRITSIFTLLGFKNYFTTSILFAWFFYIGYWKLFLLLNELYPKYRKEFAIAVFFLPSVIFWGSGILKDTITLSLTGWFIYSFYIAFIFKKDKLKNIIIFAITGYLILAIKPYIIVALLPGIFIWIGWSYIRKIENQILRLILLPVTTFFFLSIAFFLLGIFSPFLGDYGSIDGIITKSIITYEDHSRAIQYGVNYYDLGEFDGTIQNFLSKTPHAIIAGIFRPFLWEISNPFMLLAALENTGLLILIIVIFWRTGIIKTFKIAFDEPFVVFSITFAIVFAFAIGVSTANFGALVRLKIPLLPFLAAGLFTLYNRSKELKQEKFNPGERTLIPERG